MREGMKVPMKRIAAAFAVLACAVAFALSLSGCGGQSASSGAKSVSGSDHEVVVSMTTTSEPTYGFDPLYSWGCGEHVHEPLIQSTLITTDADLNFVNDLATDYYSSEDGLTWTFKIRDDVKFTDGEPLTASDVAFTINGIKNNEAAEADLSMVESAEAVDDTTAVIHLNKPFNALLYTLAVVGIVPEHAYDSATYGANPIGSGRYMLDQWDKGEQVILKANPDYYGEAPNMERVVVVFMDEDASLAAANSQQVDVAYAAATIADKADPEGYNLLACKSVDSRGISLPCIPAGDERKDGEAIYPAGNNVTCDIALRRAINYGVDRQRMIDNVLASYGTPAYSVSDGMPWYNDAMKVDYDPEKAKSTLEEAGWKLGEDGIYVKDGVRASFPLNYGSSDSVRQALSVEFANQMKEIGIEINVKGGSWDEIYPLEYSEPVLWGWGANTPTQLYDLSYSSGWGNFACYDNEAVDEHLNAALAAPTVQDSYEDWKLAQWDGSQGVNVEGGASWVWLANIDHLYFQRDGLEIAKQKPHPHGHGWSLVNNVNEWKWK